MSTIATRSRNIIYLENNFVKNQITTDNRDSSHQPTTIMDYFTLFIIDIVVTKYGKRHLEISDRTLESFQKRFRGNINVFRKLLKIAQSEAKSSESLALSWIVAINELESFNGIANGAR